MILLFDSLTSSTFLILFIDFELSFPDWELDEDMEFLPE